MRYGNSESTNILSSFDTGLTITIDIYDLSDNSLIVDNLACSEVGTTGVYKYYFSNSNTVKSEFLWIMKSSLDNRSGKIVLGGIIDDRFIGTDRTKLNSLINYDDSLVNTKLDGIKTETDKIQPEIIDKKDEFKATEVVATNMRGTDNANTIEPDNAGISAIQSKVDTLENYDDSNTQSKLDNIQTETNKIQSGIIDNADAYKATEVVATNFIEPDNSLLTMIKAKVEKLYLHFTENNLKDKLSILDGIKDDIEKIDNKIDKLEDIDDILNQLELDLLDKIENNLELDLLNKIEKTLGKQ